MCLYFTLCCVEAPKKQFLNKLKLHSCISLPTGGAGGRQLGGAAGEAAEAEAGKKRKALVGWLARSLFGCLCAALRWTPGSVACWSTTSPHSAWSKNPPGSERTTPRPRPREVASARPRLALVLSSAECGSAFAALRLLQAGGLGCWGVGVKGAGDLVCETKLYKTNALKRVVAK